MTNGSTLVVDQPRLAPLPANMSEIVRKLAEQPPDVSDERRKAPRFAMSLSTHAVPLDGDMQPCGRPFVMMSRNISVGGMALVYSRPIAVKFLVVAFESEGQQPMRLVLRVLRCRRIRRFFEISGQFVGRISE